MVTRLFKFAVYMTLVEFEFNFDEGSLPVPFGGASAASEQFFDKLRGKVGAAKTSGLLD